MINFTLHVGAPRTGTTRIQTVLDSNYDFLLTKGVLALTPPRPGKRNEQTVRSVIGLARGSATSRTGWATKHLARRKFSRLIPGGARSAVISDESMLGPIFDRKTGVGLFPNVVKNLRPMVHLTRNRIQRVCLAIRSYDSFIPSAYAMAALYNRDKFAVSALQNALVNPNRGWVELISDIVATIPDAEIIVWHYEDVAFESQLKAVVGDVSVDSLSIIDTGVVNAAPTLEAIRHVQGDGVMDDRHADTIVKQFESGRRFDPFSESAKKELRLRYAEDSDRIRKIDGIHIVSQMQ
ncbi:hypothetical protein [Stieleria mannarensis]|uniref:hypothetical protein n=1 Tax=Stieleria mannarensis TaxID=2755585 RepID=UPI001603B140|nr:hypothetical protein [Rhodopirellula sp. JC639]